MLYDLVTNRGSRCPYQEAITLSDVTAVRRGRFVSCLPLLSTAFPVQRRAQ